MQEHHFRGWVQLLDLLIEREAYSVDRMFALLHDRTPDELQSVHAYTELPQVREAVETILQDQGYAVEGSWLGDLAFTRPQEEEAVETYDDPYDFEIEF